MLPAVHRRAARRHRQPASTARVVPPPQVVRYDGDDPYLVVAADKGTAAFSDIANEIAVARGFWLGDAFASGGSHGYDHKEMGITARGAWESVTPPLPPPRHRPRQRHDFTVVGIGDMSGDVFGNGMLLSRAHPARRRVRPPARVPRPGSRSGDVRSRSASGCSTLPRSSWADYDTHAHLAGRRRVPPHREVDRDHARGARAARHRRRRRGAARRPS